MGASQVRNNSIREMREVRSNVQAQNKFENQFAKPSADKEPATLDNLYFKGVTGKAPSRINPTKNTSSIDRVYGLDVDPTQPQLLQHQNSLPSTQGQQPGNQAIASSPAMSYGKGKKQVSTVRSTSNLIAGNYGTEQPAGVQIKPYSKPMNPGSIDNAGAAA